MAQISIFIPSFEGGGAERAMITLANEFAARGHDVDLLVGLAIGPFAEETDKAVKRVVLGHRRVMRCVPALAAYLRRERPAVLLSAMTHCNVAALLARRLAGTGTRIVVSEQSSLERYKHDRRGWKDRLLRLAMRLTYGAADVVTVVAQDLADELILAIPLDPAKVRVVGNPLVSDRLSARAKATPRHPWMSAVTPVILAVGRLAPSKDYVTLIRAFGRLKQPARLLILGEGAGRPRLEALVEQLGLADRVALPGFDPNPFAYMRRAALFVLSSCYEGLPSVLVEAMACGAPVVSTDCRTGPREILEGGRWGALVPVGNVERLAGAIDAVLAGVRSPDGRGRAADFGTSAIAKRYIELLLPAPLAGTSGAR